MKRLPRRAFLHLASGAIALPAVSRMAFANIDASRPVRIVTGFAPGSSADVVARLLAEELTARLAQTFVVDNQPGVGGNIATEAVVQAPADGHTLLLLGPSHAINATLYDKLGFDVLHDIVPVAGVAQTPNVMLVNPSVPARTVSEFIALTNADPDRIRMASAGIGSASHMAGELFRMMTGAQMVHVAYRGGAGAFSGLIDGTVDVYVPSLASSIGHIKSGKLRALAVTSAPRLQALPGVPTVGESVPAYDASTWFGIGAPRNTPAGVVARLNREIRATLAEPTVKARLAALGATPIPSSQADFGRLLANETAKWARVLNRAAATS
jgi:tripartite-type tricarboxylate transporter receptor subunit TctC